LPSGGEVEVLGTRFDVDSRGADLQVAVVEGTVRMRVRDDRLQLTANQVAWVPEDGAIGVRTVLDPFEAIEWLGAFVAFEATPLQQVVDEFARRFGIQVEVADGTLLSRTVTGWFTDQTPEMMIGSICTVIGAQCDMNGDVVTMRLNGTVGANTGDSS
jgi:transmembrane sensor